MNADEMRALLQKACDKAGSQSAFARKVGVSVAHVNAVLHGKPPGRKILEAFTTAIVTCRFRKIGRRFGLPQIILGDSEIS
jgi:hypothetical protein